MKKIIPAFFCLIFSAGVFANDISGIWYTKPTKSGVVSVAEIFEQNGKYYAYAFDYKTGAEKAEPFDVKNPNPALRAKPVFGLVFLYDLEFNGKDFSNGKIYDPETGTTYYLKAKIENGHTLVLRAAIDAAGVFAANFKWNRAENPAQYTPPPRDVLHFPF